MLINKNLPLFIETVTGKSCRNVGVCTFCVCCYKLLEFLVLCHVVADFCFIYWVQRIIQSINIAWK